MNGYILNSKGNFGVIFTLILDLILLFCLPIKTSLAENRSFLTVGSYTPIGLSIIAPLTYSTVNIKENWLPAFPIPQQDKTQNSTLNAVSCITKDCLKGVIVGSYVPFGEVATNPLSYYTINGGHSWLPTFPPYVGSNNSTLNSISCTAAQTCISVGFYQQNATEFPLIYRSINGGKTWSAILPIKQGDALRKSSLSGVSCNEENLCVAVGSYTPVNAASSLPLSYYSTNKGQTWVASIPNPQGDTSKTSHLLGIHCRKQGLYCIAVGFFTPLSHANRASLSYYSNNGGKTWHIIIPPPQGDDTKNSALTNISCHGPQEQYCVAVGYFTRLASNNISLQAYYSTNGGQSWNRSKLTQQGDISKKSALTSVVCKADKTTSLCVASGFYTPIGLNTTQGITYYSNDNGQTWGVNFPLPQGDIMNDSTLTAIS